MIDFINRLILGIVWGASRRLTWRESEWTGFCHISHLRYPREHEAVKAIDERVRT